MKTLTEKLQFLTKHGLTQTQIAKHCGCMQSNISLILSGHVKDPRGSICRAVDELYLSVLNKIVIKSKES